VSAPCQGQGPKALTAFILVQEKWTLRIVHALRPGPIGFNQMKRDVGGINSTTLAQRLVLLEQAGLLHKTVQSTMPPRTSYELTAAGHALAPIIDAIATWGERYLPDAPTAWADGDGACPADLPGEGTAAPAPCTP
jgi:DNA-binding HxlR family transcriptional regulator